MTTICICVWCFTLKNRMLDHPSFLSALVHVSWSDSRHGAGTLESIHHPDAHSGLWFGLLTSVADWLTFALRRETRRMLCTTVWLPKQKEIFHDLSLQLAREKLFVILSILQSKWTSSAFSVSLFSLSNSPLLFCKYIYTTNQSWITERKIPTLPWKRKRAVLCLPHSHQTEKTTRDENN